MGISTAEAMRLAEQGAIDATTGINAVVMGMQTNFAGGMDAMSKTVPGLLSTIKDNASMVLKEIGDSLTTALNLQGLLSAVANWLTQFAAVVKGAGIKEAIQGLVPPEAIAAVFAISGAIVAAAVPAMYALAVSTWAALAPMLPFIAAGVAIGALAYEIWNNWEPLCELFAALWSTVAQLFADAWDAITDVVGSAWDAITTVINDNLGWALDIIAAAWTAAGEVTGSAWSSIADFFGSAWQAIKQIVADGVAWIVNAMQPLLELIGAALPEGVKALFSNLASGIGSVGAALGKFHAGGIDVSGITGTIAPKPNTTFSGLHGRSGVSGGGSGGGTGGVSGGGSGGGTGGVDKEAQAMDKLADKAEQTSKRIQKEWVQLTGTKMDALDEWYADETAKLDESKSANANYERDLQRVNDVYAEKRRKIQQQEEQDKLDSFKKIADAWLSTQKTLTLGGMTGSQKEMTGMAFDTLDKIKSASAQYDQIAADYVNGTATQKANILAALDQVGIAYIKTAEDTLNFDMAKSAEANAYKKQLMQDYTAYYASCKDVQADIDAAYSANSLAQLQTALTAERAERMNDYTAQQSMMQTWQAAMLAAHATTAELMAGLYSAAFSGLQTTFSDILTGAASIREAFASLGKALLKTIADFVAKWISGQIMMAVFGKATAATQYAVSAAFGAATAAAWAPAAAMVSLATMGGNAGPASAALLGTTGLATALAVPQLANGGLATGPSLAVIGEGRYKEAVLPLNDRVFGKIADGINGSGGGATITQNVYGDINTEADYDRIYADFGSAVASALRGA